jgi:DNA-binding response OmpR family regulator
MRYAAALLDSQGDPHVEPSDAPGAAVVVWTDLRARGLRPVPMRVLLVEDSAPTRDLLERSLGEAGIELVTAARLSTGLRCALTEEFDVIVLDLMLPDGSGLDLCREVRAQGVTTPILCLTARGEVADRVEGLNAGADDYLRKPFALAELHARLRALARRRGQAPPARLELRALFIDFDARRLVRGEHEIALTSREWAVLETLVSKAGRVVSRGDLLDSVWHDTSRSSSDSLDVILSRLRHKLGGPESGCAIRTLRGEGFVFETIS